MEEIGGGGGMEVRGFEAGGVGGGREGAEIRLDFGAGGGGGLGRHGRTGGREEGREGGGVEVMKEMDGVSSGPVRGLEWPASVGATLASIISPQIDSSASSSSAL